MVRGILILSLMLMAMGGWGQTFDFTKPERLPSAINSDDEECMPLLSRDGEVLFFVRSAHPGNKGGRYAGQDIWTSSWKGQEKADNTKIPFNTKGNNAVIGQSSDGSILYMFNGSAPSKVGGISFSKRTSSGGWSEPEEIPIEGIESYGSLGFYVSPDFDVIFISMQGTDSRGEEDLYVSTKDATGKWSKPKNMGPTLNTAGYEISPFLSSDKKRLYFTSSGHAGLGDGDIFYADKLYDSWEAWSLPKNLGESINSNKFDGYLSVHQDSLFLFVSNRGGKSADIYYSKIKESSISAQQSIEVAKLLEESKSILKNLKGESGSSKFLSAVISFNSNYTLMESDKVTVGRLAKETAKEVILLGPLGRELRSNTAMFARTAKSELARAGIDESRISIPPLEHAMYKESELQEKLLGMSANDILVVIVP